MKRKIVEDILSHGVKIIKHTNGKLNYLQIVWMTVID